MGQLAHRKPYLLHADVACIPCRPTGNNRRRTRQFLQSTCLPFALHAHLGLLRHTAPGVLELSFCSRLSLTGSVGWTGSFLSLHPYRVPHPPVLSSLGTHGHQTWQSHKTSPNLLQGCQRGGRSRKGSVVRPCYKWA